jgi:thiamine biosynthesis lipoprotein
VLTHINHVAHEGGTVTPDPETAAILDYAEACYVKSSGAFDITSVLSRRTWNFSVQQLP